MKKTFFPILAIVASLAFLPCCLSCSQEDQPEQEQETPEDKDKDKDQDKDKDKEQDDGKPKAGDYTFTASALKGTWAVGDQIYVHGSYFTGAKTFTLAASNISSDGKTATLHLDESMMEFLALPDFLYAVYPAQAAVPGDGLMDSNIDFTQWDVPLCLAYLKGTDFAFTDATAGFRFSVSGDYDSYALAGNQRPGLRVLSYSADYNSTGAAPASPRVDGYPFLYGDITGGGASFWYPGGLTLKKGFTLYLGKDGAWPMAYTVDTDFSLEKGKITDLGDITASLVPYSGPEPKMPEMGERTKFSVKFNELSGLCLSTDGTFLWAVDDNGPLGRISFEGEVLQKISMSGEHEAVTIDPATGDLLIGNEEPVSIYRVPGPDFNKRTKLFTIAGTSGFGNAGLEGLTYYKEGQILAGMQTGSWLFCCDLATGEVLWKKEMRRIFPVITEIADVCYDPLTDWLWILDSESHKFFALSGDAETLFGSYTMKGTDNPEAICIDHERSCIWIGDDCEKTSYIYRYDFTGLDDAILP